MLKTSSVYLVGGAVRDKLLGKDISDLDYVVVGATPESMTAAGYIPVGKDFPVFLHPDTKHEYALARCARKRHSSRADVRFCPDVTLEEDLGRRDLTINAIAQDANGAIYDPYSGRHDLEAGMLRHVSILAFVEDPLRILRLARFCAMLPTFGVAPETLALAKAVVASGALKPLPPERVWQELSKGLMSAAPWRMIEFMRDCGALKSLIPELDALWGVPQPVAHHPEVDTGVHTLLALRQAAKNNASLVVRFAVLMHDLGKGITPAPLLPAHHGHEEAGVALVKAVCERLKVPNDVQDVAIDTCKLHTKVHGVLSSRNSTVVKLIISVDGLRRPWRLEALVQACTHDARGRTGKENVAYPQSAYLLQAREVIANTSLTEVVANNVKKEFLCDQIHAARVSALALLERPTVPLAGEKLS